VNRKDFNRDSHTDVLWYHAETGTVAVWWMNGTTVQGDAHLNWHSPSSHGWVVKGTGDFGLDRRPDVIWHHPESGQLSVWALNGTNVVSESTFGWNVPASQGWELKGTGDFNLDGRIDLLWHNGGSGQVGVWHLHGMTVIEIAELFWNVLGSTGWEIKGTGDFNRDAYMDILWQQPVTGKLAVWLMNGTTVTSAPEFATTLPGSEGWQLMGTGDYNGDDNIDLLWHHPGSGVVRVWFLNGTTVTGTADMSWNVPGSSGWEIVSR
jgi:hypothetical protein